MNLESYFLFLLLFPVLLWFCISSIYRKDDSEAVRFIQTKKKRKKKKAENLKSRKSFWNAGLISLHYCSYCSAYTFLANLIFLVWITYSSFCTVYLVCCIIPHNTRNNYCTTIFLVLQFSLLLSFYRYQTRHSSIKEKCQDYPIPFNNLPPILSCIYCTNLHIFECRPFQLQCYISLIA